MKILDCTFRDGGYYTNWDFSDQVMESYITAMNLLPVDYIELGYRNKPANEYMGRFGYTPVSVLEQIRKRTNKKLAVMLNEKSTTMEDVATLVAPIAGLIDMVRIAVDPQNTKRAAQLAKAVKSCGVEVGFNMMYMSKWKSYEGFFDNLSLLNGAVDVFSMVDSFGGVMPDEVKAAIAELRSRLDCQIGFHGHNNLQMGLINAITAIDNGIDFVDATILGMGRGAGNLNLELLLSYLNKRGLEFDFNHLSDALTPFLPLHERYRWGTQLPYMISGTYSLPQKEVMALMTNRVYSLDSIVRGLQNQKNKVADNAQYPQLETPQVDNVIVIGGGNSPVEHLSAIKTFINNQPSTAIVFATARYVDHYRDLDVPKYYCLVGREAKRLSNNLKSKPLAGKCVLPPYPRKLGTEVPDFANGQTYELPSIDFTNHYMDSCTTLALETARRLTKGEVYVVGYDGYLSVVMSEKEVELTTENKTLFDDYRAYTGHLLISLTPTLYTALDNQSIYQYI